MKKYRFVCDKCKKVVWLQEDIYLKVYVNQNKCLSCRSKNKHNRKER